MVLFSTGAFTLTLQLTCLLAAIIQLTNGAELGGAVGVYPPRVGRPDLQKRAADLASFPRVGRATSGLQPFPRLGRAPSSLAVFPRVGRAGGGDTDLTATWCEDCPDMELLRQLARRAVVMPPRVGRAGMQSMLPRPRVGKRLPERSMGLMTFPRVGRAGEAEEQEDPRWFAEPAKRENSEPDKHAYWFGPRLGRRRRRDLSQQIQEQDTASPESPQYIIRAEPADEPSSVEQSDDVSRGQQGSPLRSTSWSSYAQ